RFIKCPSNTQPPVRIEFFVKNKIRGAWKSKTTKRSARGPSPNERGNTARNGCSEWRVYPQAIVAIGELAGGLSPNKRGNTAKHSETVGARVAYPRTNGETQRNSGNAMQGDPRECEEQKILVRKAYPRERGRQESARPIPASAKKHKYCTC